MLKKINLSIFLLVLTPLITSPSWAAAGGEKSAEEWANEFITRGMNARDRNDILSVIRRIPSEQRPDVLGRAPSFITRSMDAHNRTTIIRAIREINSTQRDDVLARLCPLIKDNMDGKDRVYLIDAIEKINPIQRDSVLRAARELITEGMDGFKQSQIIRVIGGINSDQRDEVLEAARLFTDGVDGNGRAEIISAIGGINSDQRDEVLEGARLFTDGVDGNGRATIIHAISQIPQARRQTVVERVQARRDAQQEEVPLTSIEREQHILGLFRQIARPQPQAREDPAREIHQFADTKVVVPATSDQSGAACEGTSKKKGLNQAIADNIQNRLKAAQVKIVDLDAAEEIVSASINRVYPCPSSGKCPRHEKAEKAFKIIKGDEEGKQYLPLAITFLQYFHSAHLDLWTQQSMGESTEAYGENTLSCTKGIQERIFTGLRGIDTEINKLAAPVERLFMLKSAFTDSNIGDPGSARRMAGHLLKMGYTRRISKEQAIEMYRKYMIEKMREAGAENDKNSQEQLKTLMETIEDYFDKKLKPVLNELLGQRQGRSRSSSPKARRAASCSRSPSPVGLGGASEGLSTTRRLRAKQDAAYEASLHEEREKERRSQEAAATNQAGPDHISRPLSEGDLLEMRTKRIKKFDPEAKTDSDSKE